jgi:hypothetical protein
LLVEMLGRKRFFLTQFEHLFDRSDFVCHGGTFSARAAATLVRAKRISRSFFRD